MPGWECAIADCGHTCGDVEELLLHQVREHQRHECRVCGGVVPAGFFAIRHVLGDHSRAQYVRHYEADSDDIRAREEVLEAVESRIDVDALREQLQASASGD